MGALRPVSVLFQNIISSKLVWQVHYQELRAIYAALKEWRVWLVSTDKPVLVFSDHAKLWYFMRSQKLTPRPALWADISVPFGSIRAFGRNLSR